MTASPKLFEENNQKINESLKLYDGRSRLLSVVRFILFFSGVLCLIWAIVKNMPVFYAVFAAIFIVFILICVIHGKITAKLKYYEALLNVNSRYSARIKGDFDGLFDLVRSGLKRRDEIEEAERYASGIGFYRDDHDYCMDLDLFGKKSLFSRLILPEQ